MHPEVVQHKMPVASAIRPCCMVGMQEDADFRAVLIPHLQNAMQ